MEYTKEQNRALCEKYPFLIPSNAFSGKRINEGAGFWPGSPEEIPEWDYEFTELDHMPHGWRIAFGEQLCDELKAELETAGILEKYRIWQLKEKYGTLRWYDNGNTKAGYGILSKYEELSARTCIHCGKPATRITRGWISPYCDDCCPQNERSVPIGEYYLDD